MSRSSFSMKNKRLRQLISKMVRSSVDAGGAVSQSRALAHIRTLKKMPSIQSILALLEFSKGIKREIAKTTLTIESPVKITSQMQKIIAKSTHISPITQTHTILTPSLLGGLRIRIGDTLIDNSVQDKLDQLKERITGA